MPYQTIIHNCHIGLLPGQVHPDMNEHHLINNPWWDEPEEIARETLYYYVQNLQQQAATFFQPEDLSLFFY